MSASNEDGYELPCFNDISLIDAPENDQLYDKNTLEECINEHHNNQETHKKLDKKRKTCNFPLAH